MTDDWADDDSGDDFFTAPDTTEDLPADDTADAFGSLDTFGDDADAFLYEVENDGTFETDAADSTTDATPADADFDSAADYDLDSEFDTTDNDLFDLGGEA